ATSENGVYYSENYGQSWIQLISGLNYLNVKSLAIDSNEFLYAGTDYGGVYRSNLSVPVEFTSFTAISNGKEVTLNWSTATELNNLGFEIQRSTEGKEFFTVGFVNGHGTTTEQHIYSYADRNLDNGTYNYRLKQVDYDGSYEYSDVIEVEWRAFNSYLLEQNYPNPFNPTTTIGFGLQNKSDVKITILNAIGEEVAVLLNEEREAGFHQVEFNAVSLPSGAYFYQLRAGEFIQTKKMILLK
ncbi:MAG: T9SS type A sorting domain-containing protein, partial [Chlorobium sp.]|nr:T9SS type A sorting domain-containing protein [Chlorobium sp.]